MLLFRQQNAGQIYDIKIANRSIEKYGTNKIFGNDGNKSKFDSAGN
jgi:hypothetical protein